MNGIQIPCCSLIVTLCAQGIAEPSTNDVAVAMTEAASRFLASLSTEERSRAFRAFDDPERMDWHNIPKAKRKGLQVREMSPEQRTLCHQLLRVALSETGYDKAVKIMALENNLREGEKSLVGGPLRDPDRYFLTIFGEPTPKGPWGWSFEGHHFSLNFVVQDGKVVSDTPSFWGANPATVRHFIEGGPAEGTRTLAKEEQHALDLVNALDETQRQRAIIADMAPAEYRGGGSPQPPDGPPVGLSAAEMSDPQKRILVSLLDAYCGNLAKPLADTRMAEIQKDGLERVSFAWAGATKPGVGHYFRAQGPSFVLELVNVQSDPAGNPANHIHSVWRNLRGDFAVPVE